jgi:SAM-dependent methyltransferase
MEELKFIYGWEWQELYERKKDRYIQQAFEFWRNRGFPYPRFDDTELTNEFRKLQNFASATLFLTDAEIQSSNIGLSLANSFHQQMWSVPFARHRTPLQCFENDHTLKSCLRKALTLWPYRRGASPSVLRTILSTFHHTRRVSNFRPTVAKAIYEKYSAKGDKILDFCAGYGGRLLGCAGLEREYVAFDPSGLQYEGLSKTVASFERLRLLRAKVHLEQVCAEESMLLQPAREYDLVFTSPPYFNCEKYELHETQSWVRYPTYLEWKEKFLAVVIREASRILKRKGVAIFSVANTRAAPVADDTLDLAKKYLTYEGTLFMRLKRLPYNASPRAPLWRYEPIHVFRKV